MTAPLPRRHFTPDPARLPRPSALHRAAVKANAAVYEFSRLARAEGHRLADPALTVALLTDEWAHVTAPKMEGAAR